MKYQKNKVYALWIDQEWKKVLPFNGEDLGLGPSWSHGFTHYSYNDGFGSAKVNYCGISYFEKEAREIND